MRQTSRRLMRYSPRWRFRSALIAYAFIANLFFAECATILSVTPQRGGLQGGTQVTVAGAGFSRNGVQVRGMQYA